MQTLILGGTGFVGRALAEACLTRGHTVTLYHRGRSNPAVLPGVEHVLGDREQGYEPLAGRRFDVVFDTSGYEVNPVRNAARALNHPSLHYVFVSTISVYSDLANTDESGPLHRLENPDGLALALPTYGGLKVACEQALDRELPGRVRHVRAGLILGPHDYDARFRYWLQRIARGGDVLAPGDPTAPTQAIDVRDLTEWMVRCAEQKRVGPCNATGVATPMQPLLETLCNTLNSNARLCWVPDEILTRFGVRPYSEMPFWLPASVGAKPIPIDRAVREGLVFRPFEQTVRDTWNWMQAHWDDEASVRANRKLRIDAGMSPEREAEILKEAGHGV